MIVRTQRKFLCFIDDTPECRVAIRFASRRAEHTSGQVALLYVMQVVGAQQWRAVEEKMREEALQEAERALYESAALVNQIAGKRPELIIREGNPRDAIITLATEDPSISILVLGASTGREGPGPLVASIAERDSARGFPIPVTIVPGNLSDEAIDALA